MVAGGLARFQDAFARALLAPEAADTSRSLAALPGFAIYRNTVLKGCIDALQANFPAVARLVGEEWFRAAAAVYARRDPPRMPMLLEYGAGFADFLAGFGPAAQLPYLPAVAQLDRFWTDAHVAPDAAPLRAQALAGLVPDRLGGIVLRPHAAARWAWFALPAYSIWSRNRKDPPVEGDEPEIAWRGEGALVVRPGDAVDWLELDEAACAFMDACAAGKPLAAAADTAVAVAPGVDLAALMARLLDAGAFAHDSELEHVK
jgi:hypothetical protein